MNKSYPSAAIVVVNWNGEKVLSNCLRTLSDLNYPNFQIIVVDNGSTDHSVRIVRNNFKAARVIRLSQNLGFAEGNNVGIREALKDATVNYVATINNDMVVSSQFLQVLIDQLQKNPRAGAICGKILFDHSRFIIDSAGDFVHPKTLRVINRGHYELDIGQYDKPCEIFSCCAGAAVYRRTMLEEVRLGNEFFDKDFFAYLEDVDLSFRGRLLGWKFYYNPKAIVYHRGSVSSKQLSPFFKEHISRRNRIWWVIKNLPEKLLLTFLLAYLRPTKEGVSFALKNPRTTFFAQIHSFFSAWFTSIPSLPKMLNKRRYIQSNRKVDDQTINSWFKKFTWLPQ